MPFDGLIYLDTSVFISAFEGNDKAGRVIFDFIANAPARSRPPFVTSALTFSELMVHPIRQGNESLIALYDNLGQTSDVHEVVPVIGDVLFAAAVRRANHPNVKLPDAIHLATAAGMHCEVFMTHDRRIKSCGPLAFSRFGRTKYHPAIEVLHLDANTFDQLVW